MTDGYHIIEYAGKDEEENNPYQNPYYQFVMPLNCFRHCCRFSFQILLFILPNTVQLLRVNASFRIMMPTTARATTQSQPISVQVPRPMASRIAPHIRLATHFPRYAGICMRTIVRSNVIIPAPVKNNPQPSHQLKLAAIFVIPASSNNAPQMRLTPKPIASIRSLCHQSSLWSIFFSSSILDLLFHSFISACLLVAIPASIENGDYCQSIYLRPVLQILQVPRFEDCIERLLGLLPDITSNTLVIPWTAIWLMDTVNQTN